MHERQEFENREDLDQEARDRYKRTITIIFSASIAALALSSGIIITDNPESIERVARATEGLAFAGTLLSGLEWRKIKSLNIVTGNIPEAEDSKRRKRRISKI